MFSLVEMENNIYPFLVLHLDYCNGLLTGLDKVLLSHFQAIQNAAARLVTSSSKQVHITSIHSLYTGSQQVLRFILKSLY